MLMDFWKTFVVGGRIYGEGDVGDVPCTYVIHVCTFMIYMYV